MTSPRGAHLKNLLKKARAELRAEASYYEQGNDDVRAKALWRLVKRIDKALESPPNG